MPITITTASHTARKWKQPKASTAEELFQHSCPKDYQCSRGLIQQSFSNDIFHANHITASHHGFVWAVFHAYSYHHHLTIRPEDVWFSILTQLNFFINAHAEEMRSSFVAHEGQKELQVRGIGSIATVDFGALASRMTEEIEKNVVDEELRSWVMPNFTTTTESDKVVAAILMMGSLQKYFAYKIFLMCGIPSVTLLGEREDWIVLVKKLEKLHQLGDEPARFAQLLRPILNNFVKCFDSPEIGLDFWSRCAHKESMGSGPSYLSGWLSVFCFWNEDGQRTHRETINHKSSPEFEKQSTEFGLDQTLSRRIDIDDIPSGFASVPVTVNDNGVEYSTMMVAGLIGIQATLSVSLSDGTKDQNDGSSHPPGEEAVIDSIQPVSGWFMYEKGEGMEQKE
ncbi:uncharacterized protein N7484_008465 [Penicillium longicatenatum]|uniref:uncharacterized protein n=1 Tax=Penicillium longicatenatum TaxID=1561947 RepID=UPI0025481AF7|nr:uncharacterized protein N7484_008465 [Penicillium longicatenatum]KAJ5635152.1 hypothetical protein N7484_008465 [Penicillium longicatenatum]